MVLPVRLVIWDAHAARQWDQSLLELLAAVYCLGVCALASFTGRQRWLHRIALGAFSGSCGELLVAWSGQLVWKYDGWSTYFLYPPSVVGGMWGLWTLLFAEFSRVPAASTSVRRSVLDALSAVWCAATLEPLAVERGWWKYSTFPYEDVSVFGIPLSVHVAYFAAFFALSYSHYEWSKRCKDLRVQYLLTVSTSLPFGFTSYTVYVQLARRIGDWASLCLLSVCICCMDVFANRLSDLKQHRTDRLAWLVGCVMIAAIHGYCILMGMLFWNLSYVRFACVVEVAHIMYVFVLWYSGVGCLVRSARKSSDDSEVELPKASEDRRVA
eukprot:TRINITY_DN23985_c0_g2_i1.p1 TRINITY_DN23985_c0_g2~~TRINITY_DN23985_c0_g2_i1.p1  ORF type:complete len:346 (-),score=35.91 TRINITY_DN23985_c0_g2_i1:297-1274(-)